MTDGSLPITNAGLNAGRKLGPRRTQNNAPKGVQVAVGRIAKKTRSIERAATPVLQSVQLRNLSGRSGQVPSLNQLLREGRASNRRIAEREKGIRQFRKAVLTEWLDQAERLWIATEKHLLKGKRFEVFAAQIGINRSSAYELLKLHPHRKKVLAQCSKHKHWPGWEICAGWFKAAVAGSDIEPDSLTTRSRGLLTPSWARFKTSNDEYGTPQAFFDHYHRIHHFTLDVCSTPPLAKCKKFYTVEQNGLKQEWVGVCWMNPPYSALSDWVRKAYEAAKNGAVVVALLPLFSDAVWFHDYASHATIELLKGRLQFLNQGTDGYSPFGHGIFVFRKKSARVGNRLVISLDGHRIGTSSQRVVPG